LYGGRIDDTNGRFDIHGTCRSQRDAFTDAGDVRPP